MVGQHHPFNGHKIGQTPGDSEGQGGLVCYCPWVKNIYLCIYLTVLGLSFGTSNLQSSLQYAGSLVVACDLLVVVFGI